LPQFAVIKGIAECIQDESASSAQAETPTLPPKNTPLKSTLPNNRQLVQHIIDTCAHIAHILDNSLDLSKLEQHKLVLANEPVHIHDIAEQIHSMLSRRTNPGVTLEVRCPAISVRGDRTRWTQLLLNLVQVGGCDVE
jgi:signal transduction histidine kinase